MSRRFRHGRPAHRPHRGHLEVHTRPPLPGPSARRDEPAPPLAADRAPSASEDARPADASVVDLAPPGVNGLSAPRWISGPPPGYTPDAPAPNTTMIDAPVAPPTAPLPLPAPPATPTNGHGPTAPPARPDVPTGAGANGAMNGHPAGATGEAGRSPYPLSSDPPNGCTPAQMRRFIKSRPWVPMHELRRRFAIDGGDDDVTLVDVASHQVFVGLPEREGRILGDLLKAGDVGFELALDPGCPMVIGVFPMRPVPRS